MRFLKSTVVRDFPTIPSITNLSARPGRALVRSPQRVYLLNWKARQMIMWVRDYRARSWLYTNIRTARGYRMNTLSLAMWPYMELHRRSEEHTSELQSRENLVCSLLLD